MKKVLTLIALAFIVSASQAQTASKPAAPAATPPAAPARYQPNPAKEYTFTFKGTVATLQGLLDVLFSSDIDHSANLTGARIAEDKARAKVVVDTLIASYNRQVKQDSIADSKKRKP